MNLPDLLAAMRDIPCWTTDDEAALLYAAAEVAPGPIVELGTFCGYGTALLAAPGHERVTTIDPHNPHWVDKWQEAIRQAVTAERTIDVARPLWNRLGLAEQIDAILLPCEHPDAVASAPAEIGLLFVDAEHEDRPLREQLALYGTRVADGGMIAFHDWNMPAWRVREIAREWMQADAASWWSLTGTSRSLYVWRREAADGAQH